MLIWGRGCLAVLGVVAGTGSIVMAAEEEKAPMAKGIQDNSFLVEEAYNQEAGVVQHIFNLRYDVSNHRGPDDRNWEFLFTQEWPIYSQNHQFSYQIPYSWLRHGGDDIVGLGDVQLNYRYQALYENDTLPAFAPRVSLILPTGDEDKGLGDDTVGYQINLPVSKIVHDRVTLHANAGVTVLPDVNGHDPVSFTLAGSAIYAVTKDFNLMLETVGDWGQSADKVTDLDHEFQAFLSPGARYAINLSAGQLVLGIAAPLGLNSASPDYGAFFYLSWEHRFLPE